MMKRLTCRADFGLEEWEETLLFVESDPNGAYNIIDIAKQHGDTEFDEILKNVSLRLAEIENIISDENDEYDLDRIKVIFEQKISLRKEAAERFKITKNIPIERLREIVKEYKDGRSD